MFCVVTGGSGSGKSGYGEQLLCQAETGDKFYIATMEVFGREDQQKVERHRRMRTGKGFITIEKPRGIEEICLEGCGGDGGGSGISGAGDEDPDPDRPPERPGERPPAALLECMSTLAANELFGTDEGTDEGTDKEERAWKEVRDRSAGESKGAAVGEPGVASADLESRAEAVFRKIQRGILHLKDQCGLLVVVTDAVFSDGTFYGPETRTYMRLLGRIDAWMAGEADQVTEVVYGIPLHLKGGIRTP